MLCLNEHNVPLFNDLSQTILRNLNKDQFVNNKKLFFAQKSFIYCKEKFMYTIIILRKNEKLM